MSNGGNRAATLDEMTAGVPTKGATKMVSSTRTSLNRPGEKLSPSGTLNGMGWALWGLSAISTAYAISSVVAVLLGRLLPLVNINLGVLSTPVTAAISLALAYFVQLRITALERPMFEGHVSPTGIVSFAVDVTFNIAGAFILAPFLNEVFHTSAPPLVVAIIAGLALTIFPELLMTLALYERKKGY